MSLNKHLYIVAFDIVSDKIRYRCVKILLSYGQRVQKSVFECIPNDKQFLEMKSKLDNTINLEVDSVRYYLLCANCEKNISVSGTGLYSYDEELIII
jgi:CRISPR-associated protein Cas2